MTMLKAVIWWLQFVFWTFATISVVAAFWWAEYCNRALQRLMRFVLFES